MLLIDYTTTNVNGKEADKMDFAHSPVSIRVSDLSNFHLRSGKFDNSDWGKFDSVCLMFLCVHVIRS